MLHVLAVKLRAFLEECDAPSLDVGARDDLGEGLPVLRDEVARHAEPDRLTFIRKLIAAQTRALKLFQSGVEPGSGTTIYTPLSKRPADQITTEPTLETSGLRELAAALSVLGRGSAGTSWWLELGPTAAGNEGMVKVVSARGAESAVFFAANGKAAVRIEGSARSGGDEGEVVIIHSTEPVEMAVRSPQARYGRSGGPRLRHVDMSSLLKTSAGLVDLETRFRQAAAL